MESEETVSRLRDKVLAARIISGPTSDLKIEFNMSWFFEWCCCCRCRRCCRLCCRCCSKCCKCCCCCYFTTVAGVVQVVADTSVAGVVAVVAAVHTAIVIGVPDYTAVAVGVAAAVEVVAVVGGQEMILLRIKF